MLQWIRPTLCGLEDTLENELQTAIKHHSAGRLNEAEAIYSRRLEQRPDDPDALHLLGIVHWQRGNPASAADMIRRAIGISPLMADYHNDLGRVLSTMGKTQDAIAAYRRALELRSDYAEAHNNLAGALAGIGQTDEAAENYQRALALKPESEEFRRNLAQTIKTALVSEVTQGNDCIDAGDIDGAITHYRKAIATFPAHIAAHDNLIYALYFHPGYDEQMIFQELEQWEQRHAAPLAATWRPHENSRDPERKLKIGYVSPDFFAQAECFFTVPLFRSHDRSRFEIHAYASVRKPDGVTEQLRSHCDQWHDVLLMSDQTLAEQIRRDGIDILVDLTMHMSRSRLLVFARKPAPVQVAWLAYPGSTGLSAMDYRLSDRFLDPPGMPMQWSSEETVSLPDCWCCYDPLGQVAPAAPRPGGPVCFGSLNHPRKLSEPTLRLWATLLRNVTDATLLMLVRSTEQRKRIVKLFETESIDPKRLEFVDSQGRMQYLRTYDRIDIVLDPLPYNGITTTCDALWMGVPVVSITGKTAAGRAGSSILHAVGLPELVASDPQQFVNIAAALALDRPRLAGLRSTLRERITRSPMMDAQRFAENLEAAYRTMWRAWCENMSNHRG
jgi:predicted O-linked N-acetylglucosamine transferase (SPINDLY family)